MRLQSSDEPFKMWSHGFLMVATSEGGGKTWPRLTSRETADLVAFLRAHGYAE